MIIYYSGEQGVEFRPEKILGRKATIMLTFFDSFKKPQKRFLSVYKKRKKNEHRQTRVVEPTRNG